MLKAHSRLFEELALISDLVLVAACWLAAYVLRFYTPRAPPVRQADLGRVAPARRGSAGRDTRRFWARRRGLRSVTLDAPTEELALA